MELFKAEVNGQWLPVWADSLDEALEKAEREYGPQNVGRVRMEVVE